MDCDYEKVRNNTMCILTVSPDGLPLPRFLKEYSETISETFPYRELGYKTPLDCLRSFKNVLNVINNPRGNDPLLVAIPENKVIHMRKLVAQQKSVSKQSKIIKSVYHNLEKRRNAQGILKTNFEPRRKMEEEKPIKSNEEESRFYVPKVDGPPKRQMVELTPSASSQKYNIIEESLDDNVPKTLDELKTNIKLLMSRHPEGIQLHSFSECYQELFCHTINPCFYGMTNLKGLLINFSPFIKVQDENVILTCEEDVEEKLKIAHRQKLKALKKRILSICEKYREKGVLLTQLSDIHKEIYDTRIKPSDFGFSNLSQILLEFRGEVKLEDSEKGLVIYESGYRPKWMKRILVPNLPASVQNRIETVLKIYQKGGIFMDKLEFGYQHHFKMNFVLSEWGYESLEDLVNYLEGKILRIDKYANDRLLLHYLPMAERDPHSLPISFDCSIISDWAVPIPENVVHPLSLFKRSKLPKDININSEVFLAAGEIISPGKFYFQFADENQKTEFEDTEYKMNDFYLNNYQQYLLPKDNIIKGMVVAVPYENFWHRARVVDPNDFQKIRLFCFDYGTYFDACLTQICYLEERFYTYPAQGHIGCLASIEPVGGQWDRNATNLFLDWFKEKVLFAYVKKIEETGKYPVVHLEVHYTHDNLDFCVNEYLVEKNYACERFPNKDLAPEAVHSEPIDPVSSNPAGPVTVLDSQFHQDLFNDLTIESVSLKSIDQISSSATAPVPTYDYQFHQDTLKNVELTLSPVAGSTSSSMLSPPGFSRSATFEKQIVYGHTENIQKFEEKEKDHTYQGEVASIWADRMSPDGGDSILTDSPRNSGILSNQAPPPEIFKFEYEGFDVITLLRTKDGYFIPARYLVDNIPVLARNESALQVLLLAANSEVEPVVLKLYDKYFGQFFMKLIRHKVLERRDVKNGYFHMYTVEKINIILNDCAVREPKIRRLFSCLVNKVQQLCQQGPIESVH
ncbi:uncharacterized protein LOC136032804 isoform X2 [Artemia franciscana]